LGATGGRFALLSIIVNNGNQNFIEYLPIFFFFHLLRQENKQFESCYLTGGAGYRETVIKLKN
jgi:hypothetical protein